MRPISFAIGNEKFVCLNVQLVLNVATNINVVATNALAAFAESHATAMVTALAQKNTAQDENIVRRNTVVFVQEAFNVPVTTAYFSDVHQIVLQHFKYSKHCLET